MPNDPEHTNQSSMEERWKAFADSDPEAYVALRGPIDQNCNSVWEGQSKRYDELTTEANASGFDSLDDAVAFAKNAKAAKAAQDDGAPHAGHAIIDDIQSNLKVQHNPGWIKGKLEELRKLL